MSRIGDRGEMEAFVRSVDLGSFSAAARELELTPSALSKLVTRLERGLGVRLLSRSTRRLAPTPEGDLFLARCRRILAEMEDAEMEVGRSRERPRGKLRMHMGVGFGISQGVRALPKFLDRYPEVELELILEDRRVDLQRENVDISTWSFPPYSANVIARKLFEFERVLCASPAYLATHGTPCTPDHLARHRCLVVSGVPLQNEWHFETPTGKRTFEVRATVAVNNVDSKFRLTVDGVGVAQFSEYIVADALRDGRLVQLMPEIHRSETLTQFALYPRERHRLPRVAAMLDFLVQTFSSRPWREGQPKRRGRAPLQRVK
jgi:DNA-binding transcriptional LysR family regulator